MSNLSRKIPGRNWLNLASREKSKRCFGGGIDETYAKIAEEIVHFIKSNY